MNLLPYNKLVSLVTSQDIKQRFLQQSNRFNFEYSTGFKIDHKELNFRGTLQVEIKERNSYLIKFGFSEEGVNTLINKFGKLRTQGIFAKIQGICGNKTEFTKEEFETSIQQILLYLKTLPGLDEIQDIPVQNEDAIDLSESSISLKDVAKDNAKFKVIAELIERASLKNTFYPLFMYNWYYSWEYDTRYLDAVLGIDKTTNSVCLAIIKRDIKTGLGKMDETKILSYVEFSKFTPFIKGLLLGNDYKPSFKNSVIKQIFKQFKEETKIVFGTKKMGSLKDASSDRPEKILETIKQSDAEKEFRIRVAGIGNKLKLNGIGSIGNELAITAMYTN